MAIVKANQYGALFALPSEEQSTLRSLLYVTSPPIDHPSVKTVIRSCYYCVKEYSNSISKPNEEFIQLMAGLQKLCERFVGADNDTGNYELTNPMYRRLSAYPTWALLVFLGNNTKNTDLSRAAGMELALAMFENRRFSKSLARNLRLNHQPSNSSNLNILKNRVKVENRLREIELEANRSFESASVSISKVASNSSFEWDAYHFLTRKIVFLPARQRQAVLDRNCLSLEQLKETAGNLRQAALQGEKDAILIILGFCCGLSVELTKKLPLHHTVTTDWFMTLDIQTGVVRTSIESFSPNHAVPSAERQAGYRDANKIVINPIPEFLITLLQRASENRNSAKNVDELLSGFQTKHISSKNETSSEMPSVYKFLNSASSLAIQLGVNRLVAAFVTNDISSIPSSKIYYGQVSRNEIWDGSRVLFEYLSWGEPVKIVEGLDVGAQVVPTRAAVSELFNWMDEEISSLRPGKRSNFESVMIHHNAFACCSAFIAVFSLACRESREFKYFADTMIWTNSFVSMPNEKGEPYPGSWPLPINSILCEQLRLWDAHCQSLMSRLKKSDIPGHEQLIQFVSKVLSRQHVSLFFKIVNGKARALGTADLLQWWPSHLRLNGNFSRSFWERELMASGLKSSAIDMLLRHILRGTEPQTSTSNVILSEWGREICCAQENILDMLAIRPMVGLAKK